MRRRKDKQYHKKRKGEGSTTQEEKAAPAQISTNHAEEGWVK